MSFKPVIHRVAVSGFFFLCGCTFATWASRIPEIKGRFHLTAGALGTVLFMLPLGSMVALPIAGWSASRFGSRTMSLLAAILYASGLPVIAACHSVPALMLALFFFGFSGDILNIAMNTQGLFVQEKIMKRSILASLHALWSAGAMTGAAIGGWTITAGLSTAQHFGWMAAVVIVTALIGWYFLSTKDLGTTGHRLMTLPDKALLLLGIICFCCTLCEGAMADWSALYYKQVIRNPDAVSTTGYIAFASMMAFGRVIGDRFIGRLGYRTILMADSGMVASGLGLAIAFPSPVTVVLGFGLVGLGVATIIPVIYSLAVKNPSYPTSVALSSVSTIGFTGFLVGPPVIGFLAQQTGLRWAWLLVLLLALFILLLTRRIKS